MINDKTYRDRISQKDFFAVCGKDKEKWSKTTTAVFLLLFAEVRKNGKLSRHTRRSAAADVDVSTQGLGKRLNDIELAVLRTAHARSNATKPRKSIV